MSLALLAVPQQSDGQEVSFLFWNQEVGANTFVFSSALWNQEDACAFCLWALKSSCAFCNAILIPYMHFSQCEGHMHIAQILWATRTFHWSTWSCRQGGKILWFTSFLTKCDFIVTFRFKTILLLGFHTLIVEGLSIHRISISGSKQRCCWNVVETHFISFLPLHHHVAYEIMLVISHS